MTRDRALRIAFIVPPLLALVILLVSVRTPLGPSTTVTVSPGFDGPRAAQFARRLAQLVPDRAPGSATAVQAADDVAGQLGEASGQTVRRVTFTAPGPSGDDVEMENVWVVEPGASSEAIVVIANRDDVAPGPGLDDNGTGTAAVVELARDLSGVERARALVLASTDGGTVGQAGNVQLLRDLRADGLRPVAVISLNAIGGPPDATLPIRFGGTGGVRTPDVVLRGLQESIDEARFGAVGAAIATLVVRLDAEPRPSPPSGAYVAVSGRIIPGRAIGLLAIALLVGPLFATSRRVLAGRLSRGGWGAALLVGAIGAVPGIVAVVVARLADLAGGVETPPGAAWPRAGILSVVLVIVIAALAAIAATWLLRRRLVAPIPLAAAPTLGLVAAVLLLAGSPASVLVAVPALWLWTLVDRPPAGPLRAAWAFGPVAAVALLIFLLRGADLATLVGAAGTGALPAALVVGTAALIGAAAVAALAED